MDGFFLVSLATQGSISLPAPSPENQPGYEFSRPNGASGHRNRNVFQ
ncbi:hypothetical protein PQR67_30565 [Paraburkholderia fungorum]